MKLNFKENSDKDFRNEAKKIGVFFKNDEELNAKGQNQCVCISQ